MKLASSVDGLCKHAFGGFNSREVFLFELETIRIEGVEFSSIMAISDGRTPVLNQFLFR
jgi:hypothetical protein